jgi:hypothetical protein
MYIDIINSIVRGEVDAQLDRIIEACQNRKVLVPVEAERDTGDLGVSGHQAYQFRVGDEVRFNSSVSPHYMIGVCGRVVKVNSKSVKVMLYSSIGRFSSARPLRCPNSIISKVA